jgi:hypothetical protein
VAGARGVAFRARQEEVCTTSVEIDCARQPYLFRRIYRGKCRPRTLELLRRRADGHAAVPQILLIVRELEATGGRALSDIEKVRKRLEEISERMRRAGIVLKSTKAATQLTTSKRDKLESSGTPNRKVGSHHGAPNAFLDARMVDSAIRAED